MKRILLYLSLFCLISAHAFGGVVITVDISNSSAVTFAASDSNASVDAGLNSYAGISLIDFLSGNTQSLDGSVNSGSLNILDSTGEPGTRIAMDRYYSADDGFGYSLQDLTFYTQINHYTEVSTTAPALTGTITLDLHGLTLPSLGSTGSVTMGDRQHASTHTFGTYNVVPEPSALSLMGIAVGIAVMIRRCLMM